MKKIFLLVFIIFLSACNSYTKTKTNTTITETEDEVFETEPVEYIPIETEYITLFYLELSAGNIFLGSEIETAIEILGEPISIHETPSCAFDGMDRIFAFNDFYINTYPQGDKNLIQVIRFRTDNITTGEGFRLGNDFDTVTEVLGFDYLRDFDMIVFTRENTNLVFFLEDNIIRDMFYELTMP